MPRVLTTHDALNPSALAEFIADRHVFEGLSEVELKTIAGLLSVLEYADGETICEQGDSGDTMYFIYEGAIRIILGGKDMDIVLQEGNVVGEMSILDGSPRSAGLIANGRTTLLGMHEDRFFGLFQDAPRIGKTILRNLARIQQDRIREMNERLAACTIEKERLEQAFRATR